ncbi:MAG: hypothetical protein QOH57_4375 [Mycobacterium sp.]|jgi:hypothetical protein|nr:hypothetical protein [Mycobacterium sp.]
MMRVIYIAALSGLAITLAGCGGGTKSPATVTVHDSSSQSNESEAKSWTMPNEVGKDLQTAQDDLQAVTGNPMFVSTSKDLTGQGRHQVMDRNWQVCSSTPPAGETFTSQTNVVFGVVRIDSEKCP